MPPIAAKKVTNFSKNNNRGRERYKSSFERGLKKDTVKAAIPPRIIKMGTVHKTNTLTTTDHKDSVPKVKSIIGRVAI